MSQLLKVQLEDEDGNIYYLHTSGDSVFLDDGRTVQAAIEQTVRQSAISNVQVNDSSKVPSAALAYAMQQQITENENAISVLNSDKGKAIYSSDLFQNYQTPIFVRWDANTENTPFKAGLTTAQLGFAFIYGNPNNYFTAVAIAQSERRIYTYSKTPENVNSWQRSALQEELPLYFSLNFGTIQSKQEVSRQVSFENPLINSYFSAIITTNSKVSYWADIVYIITNKTVNGCTITAYNNGGDTTGTITADCMIVPQRTFDE